MTTDKEMILEAMDIIRTLIDHSVKIKEKLMFRLTSRILNYLLRGKQNE